MIGQTIEKEIPRLIEIQMKEMRTEIGELKQRKNTTRYKEMDRTSAEQNKMTLIIEGMKADLDRQRGETNRVREELAILQASKKMEADARKESSDEQNMRMNELGNTIKKTFKEGERRREIDRQIT